jgi:hypothetical protein
MPTRYVRFAELKQRGYVRNRMTLKRWIEAGIFPRPIELGPNTRARTEEQLSEHDARLRAERGAGKSAA